MIQCSTPTVEAAIKLQSRLTLQKWEPLPWAIFHPQFAALTGAVSLNNWQEAEQTWLQNRRAWHDFVEANPAMDYKWRDKQYRNYFTQDSEVIAVVSTLHDDVELRNTTISRHDRTLELKIESPAFQRIEALIQALVQWLRSEGCEVKYQLYQT